MWQDNKTPLTLKADLQGHHHLPLKEPLRRTVPVSDPVYSELNVRSWMDIPTVFNQIKMCVIERFSGGSNRGEISR